MSFEETLRTIVREELERALSRVPATPPAVQKQFTISQLAALTNLPKSYIAKLRDKGYLVARGTGRSRRYTHAELEEAQAKSKAAEAPVAKTVDAQAERILKSVGGGKR